MVTGVLTLVLSLVPVPVEGRRFGPYGPDKWPHVVSHALLAGALADALAADRTRLESAAIGAATSTIFGAVVEALQDVVPWRTGEDVDVVAGALGALVGAVGWLVGSRTDDSLDSDADAAPGPAGLR